MKFWTFSAVTTLSFFSLPSFIHGQNLCDDAYALHCPEESGWDVGDCLKKQNEIGAGCESFIELHETCKSDIETHCNGKEYTGDLLPCLTEWTKPDVLSPECVAKFPKKEPPKEKRKSKEDKQKADARRRKRENAAKIAREF